MSPRTSRTGASPTPLPAVHSTNANSRRSQPGDKNRVAWLREVAETAVWLILEIAHDHRASMAYRRRSGTPPTSCRPHIAGVLGTRRRRRPAGDNPATAVRHRTEPERTHPDPSVDRIPVSPRLTDRGTIGEMTGGRLPGGLDGDRWAGRYAPTRVWVSTS